MQPGILDERACLYLPSETAERAAARRRRIPPVSNNFIFTFNTPSNDRIAQGTLDGARWCMCAASILDKADNERADTLFHSPCSVAFNSHCSMRNHADVTFRNRTRYFRSAKRSTHFAATDNNDS